MLDTETPPPAPKALAVIETDAYCDACGYNLRTQPVWRDERLGIIVCRCPECGAHRAAGLATVGSVWARRAAVALLFVWVILCTAGVLVAAGITLALQQEAGGVFTYGGVETRDGADVRHNMLTWNQTVYWPMDVNIDFRLDSNSNYKAYLLPAQTELDMNGPPFIKPTEVLIRYHAADWMTGRVRHKDVDEASPRWEIALVYTVASGLLAGVFGLVMACVCWHWGRGRRWVWVLLPLLTLAVALTLGPSMPHRWLPTLPIEGEHLARTAVIAVAIWQALAVGVGLLVGRAVVRLLIRLFVPRLARTPLSFLWAADNKPMPRAVV